MTDAEHPEVSFLKAEVSRFGEEELPIRVRVRVRVRVSGFGEEELPYGTHIP